MTEAPAIGTPIQFRVRWSPGHESTYAAIVTNTYFTGHVDLIAYERLTHWADKLTVSPSIADEAQSGTWWERLPA